MKRIALMALALPVFLVGCGDSSEEGDNTVTTNETKVNNATKVNTSDNGGYDVNMFTTVIDGHNCIVASVYESVSLQCEGMDDATQ